MIRTNLMINYQWEEKVKKKRQETGLMFFHFLTQQYFPTLQSISEIEQSIIYTNYDIEHTMGQQCIGKMKILSLYVACISFRVYKH